MKSHHAALLSMVTILVIGACSMFYIHVHREDSARREGRQVAVESVETTPPKSTKSPAKPPKTEQVELANYLAETSRSGGRLLLVLGDSEPLGEQLVLRLKKETPGEKSQVYALQVVDAEPTELTDREPGKTRLVSHDSEISPTEHARPCGLVSMRAR